MKQEKKFKKLRIFNVVMGFFHALQGTLMLYLSNDFTLPINSSFLKFIPEKQALSPFIEKLYDIKVGPAIACFLFLSALAHFIISLPGINSWYVKNLKKGANFARWIEYSASSSLMIVIISMLVGIYDIASLILIFAVNTCMILFGWMMERHNMDTNKVNWTSFIFGSFAGLIPWVCVAIYLFGSGDGDNKAPTFVYWIFFSMFIFFNLFAINMILQYKKVGPWRDYLFGEKMYIILSLVAKSLLAWQVFAGTLRPV